MNNLTSKRAFNVLSLVLNVVVVVIVDIVAFVRR